MLILTLSAVGWLAFPQSILSIRLDEADACIALDSADVDADDILRILHAREINGRKNKGMRLGLVGLA